MKSITFPIVISTIFWASVVYWINTLQKKQCECSQDWRRDFIKYYAIAALVVQGLLLLNQGIPKPALMLLGLASLTFIGVTISYVMSQRKKQCGCSSGTEESLLFWFAVIQGILVIWATYSKFKG